MKLAVTMRASGGPHLVNLQVQRFWKRPSLGVFAVTQHAAALATADIAIDNSTEESARCGP